MASKALELVMLVYPKTKFVGPRMPWDDSAAQLAERPVLPPEKLPVVLVSAAALLMADLVAGLVLAVLIAGPAALLAVPLAQQLGYFAGGAVVAMAATVIWIAASGLYTDRLPAAREATTVLLAGFLPMALVGIYHFGAGAMGAAACALVAALLLPAVLLALRHVVRGALDRAGYWKIPVLLLGEGDASQDLLREMWGGQPGFRAVRRMALADAARLQGACALRDAMVEAGAQRVVLAGGLPDALAAGLLARLSRQQVPFVVLPRLEGLPAVGLRVAAVAGSQHVVMSASTLHQHPVARAAKAAFDVASAALLLLVLAPLMLTVAVLVRRDGGPALFAHRRIGAGGAGFPCYKFRTMVLDSDKVLRAHLAANPAAAEEWMATQKLRDDPRVTRIGDFLRRTSLDELPQLLNVLFLQMSLVGPRPIVEAEMARYGEDIAYYTAIRPGVTGLWQVSGRSSTTYQRRVELDSWYVRNWSLWYDMVILLKTIPAVLRQSGAH